MADLFTIGHSIHSLEKLLELLKMHEITAVADVRSAPYSRFNPQFNRESLCAELKAANIGYFFYGRNLGGRTQDKSCYLDGKLQYELLSKTAAFKDGIRQIVDEMDRHRIALMCAEEDPLMCHRSILVSRHLVDLGVAVAHIREDGSLNSHEEALNRLVSDLKIGELFGRDYQISEAYSKRGNEIAYIEIELSPRTTVAGIGR